MCATSANCKSQSEICINYMVRTTIFSHRIVHLVYKYMFWPCILVIIRWYYNLTNKCKMCAWGTLGVGKRFHLIIVGGMTLDYNW